MASRRHVYAVEISQFFVSSFFYRPKLWIHRRKTNSNVDLFSEGEEEKEGQGIEEDEEEEAGSSSDVSVSSGG